ncbi:dienelactone hydrolase family protein [Coxiella burnetii]|uniref:Carboxymethylenebutenolidase n=1 Tax=Coxiella burnetii (strain RSA 493 / Nine Mile phase I) TaxID=227377 RepID=Q83CJ6_COXBU|nr:dienelactone hydrolase family protein [Coxiella burnetii]NP_820118.2 carboxymethylenebutenolidase [Coxiella burnetii RSA 493]AAO90632.2 carboxymethylenebutenolidase [Coxiella burnetii RSA 493]ARI65927.1 carboxymethylenebutenolidase [Coxiella burnetii]MCF2093652.1 dienelactone hydrolase family protein [Coxiella burnetii]MCF2096415.1 dienelactone hydrolase family protein [Coxiella burnetii]MCF2097643.1 dienelactone hydrolase family protein [Coxiella burnetii]
MREESAIPREFSQKKLLFVAHLKAVYYLLPIKGRFCMHTETIDYRDGDAVLQAYVAYDKTTKEKRPLVLIAHAWAGRDEFVEEKARQLAELGYVGFAMDIYGKGVLGASKEENGRLMKPFMDDRKMLRHRLLAALETAKTLTVADENKIAAMGYCFGGLCVLDLARSGAPLKGVVSFHGLLKAADNLPSETIPAKILALHGHDDPMVPPEAVLEFEKEMTKAKVDWQLHVFSNTMHAFTNPSADDPDFGTVYNPVADKRSWLEMKLFFEEIFK